MTPNDLDLLFPSLRWEPGNSSTPNLISLQKVLDLLDYLTIRETKEPHSATLPTILTCTRRTRSAAAWVATLSPHLTLAQLRDSLSAHASTSIQPLIAHAYLDEIIQLRQARPPKARVFRISKVSCSFNEMPGGRGRSKWHEFRGVFAVVRGEDPAFEALEKAFLDSVMEQDPKNVLVLGCAKSVVFWEEKGGRWSRGVCGRP